MISLADKVAVVTGAAGGIGAATARLLSTAGAAVVISDINIDAAKAVAEEIRSQGGTAQAVRTDISNAWPPEKREQAANALGRPGHPHEIVSAALFLASPASSFTNGALVRVDGGMQIGV